ncbi:hypothetical protein ACFOQM_22395 [Paenibacillus sp. GCM10012307]|uniref:Uncharacterized protein n=1 Tax=Paenibacillus roseus TaxID=2798579 RepID=A0A934JB88_9BACL|nr:hypothetical protein [Paenibacillus roseus]MBJ6363981.1 hypothetical protein [Paenibacillus roseus]
MSSIRQGKLLLSGVIAILLIYQFAALFLSGQIVSFIIHCALLLLLYSGFVWAKFILAGLMLITVAVGLLGLAGILPMNLPYPAATLGILSFYAISSMILLFSPSIRAYMRTKTKRGNFPYNPL